MLHKFAGNGVKRIHGGQTAPDPLPLPYSTKLAIPRHSREATKRERYDSVHRMRLGTRHGTPLSFRNYTDYPCSNSFLDNLSGPGEPMARVFHNIFEFRVAMHDLEVLHRRRPSKGRSRCFTPPPRTPWLEQSGGGWAYLPYKVFDDCDEGLFCGKSET